MSTTADDMNFDWLDDEPKKPGPPKGRVLTPEQRAKYAKNGTHRGPNPKNKKLGQRRLADGTLLDYTMTDAKWRRALEMISEGVHLNELARKLKLTENIFRAYLITNVQAHKQLREAQLLWLRRSWTMEDIDAILDKIAMGQTVKASCMELGFSENKVVSFYRLMRQDRVMREVYDQAREIQAESWLDDSIDIADDRADDRYIDAKGVKRVNHEVIQRSKLRIDQRNWSSGVLNRKRFGDHKHVDHGGDITINHAALLTGARKRLESVQQKRGVTLEGEATAVSRAGAQAK